MITLPKPNDNLGGLLRIWSLPSSAVASLENGVLTLISPDDVISLYITPESARSDCHQKRSLAGTFYEVSVGGFTPRIRREAGELFSAMAGRSFVVVLQDGNGEYQVAGSPEEPLRFSFSAQTGTSVADRSGYELRFERECTTPVQTIQNPFL